MRVKATQKVCHDILIAFNVLHLDIMVKEVDVVSLELRRGGIFEVCDAKGISVNSYVCTIEQLSEVCLSVEITAKASCSMVLYRN